MLFDSWSAEMVRTPVLTFGITNTGEPAAPAETRAVFLSGFLAFPVLGTVRSVFEVVRRGPVASPGPVLGLPGGVEDPQVAVLVGVDQPPLLSEAGGGEARYPGREGGNPRVRGQRGPLREGLPVPRHRKHPSLQREYRVPAAARRLRASPASPEGRRGNKGSGRRPSRTRPLSSSGRPTRDTPPRDRTQGSPSSRPRRGRRPPRSGCGPAIPSGMRVYGNSSFPFTR